MSAVSSDGLKPIIDNRHIGDDRFLSNKLKEIVTMMNSVAFLRIMRGSQAEIESLEKGIAAKATHLAEIKQLSPGEKEAFQKIAKAYGIKQ